MRTVSVTLSASVAPQLHYYLHKHFPEATNIVLEMLDTPGRKRKIVNPRCKQPKQRYAQCKDKGLQFHKIKDPITEHTIHVFYSELQPHQMGIKMQLDKQDQQIAPSPWMMISLVKITQPQIATRYSNSPSLQQRFLPEAHPIHWVKFSP